MGASHAVRWSYHDIAPRKDRQRTLNMHTVAPPGIPVKHIERTYQAGGCSFRCFCVLRDSPTGITSNIIPWIFFSNVSQSKAKKVFALSACPPIVERAVAAGGVNVSVNHPWEAGQRVSEREPGSVELLNKANKSALRKPLLPNRIQHQRASGGRRLNLWYFSHKCSYGLLNHFRRKAEVFLNLTA